MMNLLSSVFSVTINQEMVDAYFQVLKPYPLDDVRKAVNHGLEKFTFMPRPAQIKSLIDQEHTQNKYENKFSKGNGYCQECGRTDVITMIDEEDNQYKCRHCYTGLSAEGITDRFRKFNEIMEKSIKSMPKGRGNEEISLGFNPGNGFPVMNSEEELKRKEKLLNQYIDLKSKEKSEK